MSEEIIEITGQDLVKKLGIDLSKYPQLPQAGHGLFQPKELLDNNEIKFKFQKIEWKKLKAIKDGPYKTGEIWYDKFYEIYYLILGKIKKYYVLNLGGDTGSAGCIEKGTINTGKDARIFVDKPIFKV